MEIVSDPAQFHMDQYSVPANSGEFLHGNSSGSTIVSRQATAFLSKRITIFRSLIKNGDKFVLSLTKLRK